MTPSLEFECAAPCPTQMLSNGQRDASKKSQYNHWGRAGPAYSKWIIEGGASRGAYDKFADTLIARIGRDAAVQVLDLASASGEPALTIAKAMPRSRVVSTDFSQGFLPLAEARIAHARLGGRVACCTSDAQNLQRFPPSSMDVVTCSFGLMFFTSPSKALREVWRVLRPGGCLVLSVWQSMERWPFMQPQMQLKEELINFCSTSGIATCSPDLSCKYGDDATELLVDLSQAGFDDVTREDSAVTFHLPSSLWWQYMMEVPFPLGELLQGLEARGEVEALHSARQRLLGMYQAAGFVTCDGSIQVPGNMYHFVTATKPGAATRQPPPASLSSGEGSGTGCGRGCPPSGLRPKE